MSDQGHGYIYRCICRDAESFSTLVEHVFSKQAQVWAFGMNSIHVQPITQQAVSTGLVADSKHGSLTEGHAFTDAAEVRWKRRNGAYDVLVLTEDENIICSFKDGVCLLDTSTHREPAQSTFMASPEVSEHRSTVLNRRSHHHRLAYREYRRKSQDVVFIRFTSCDPEERV